MHEDGEIIRCDECGELAVYDNDEPGETRSDGTWTCEWCLEDLGREPGDLAAYQ